MYVHHKMSSSKITRVTYPEFNQEESVLRALLVQLLESSFLLWKLVVDLSDVHGLQQRVAVGGVSLANVDKQVFAVL